MYIKDWTSYSIANSWKKKLIMKFVNLIILILGFIYAYEAKTVSEIKISILQQVFAFKVNDDVKKHLTLLITYLSKYYIKQVYYIKR